MSIVLFVLAACAAAASEVLLTRANPGVRLPVWLGRPPRYPTAARVLRGLAVGLALFGSISLTDRIGWWGVLLIAAVLLPAFLVRRVQNARNPAQPVR
jgi:hypothetical protein